MASFLPGSAAPAHGKGERSAPNDTMRCRSDGLGRPPPAPPPLCPVFLGRMGMGLDREHGQRSRWRRIDSMGVHAPPPVLCSWGEWGWGWIESTGRDLDGGGSIATTREGQGVRVDVHRTKALEF
eukprot:scaffold109_cov368-Pavlova_lutheri.AAC.27